MTPTALCDHTVDIRGISQKIYTLLSLFTRHSRGMSDQRKGNRFGRQAITHERRQRTEILQQPQDAREEVEGGLEETMDMLKGNDRELRVIVDRRMVELKAEN